MELGDDKWTRPESVSGTQAPALQGKLRACVWWSLIGQLGSNRGNVEEKFNELPDDHDMDLWSLQEVPSMTPPASAAVATTAAAARVSAEQQAKVFISYSWANREEVDKLYNKLTKSGIRCWKDDKQLGVADDFLEKIEHAIRSCPVFLCCMTKEYYTSRFGRLEISYALKLRKKIAPLKLDKEPMAEWIDIMISNILYYDVCRAAGGGCIDWNSPAFDDLIRQIRNI